MLQPTEIKAQNSFEMLGNLSNSRNSQFRLNGFESNVPGFNAVRDWEFSVMYGSEFSGTSRNNLYLISLSKRLGSHYFAFRYTPGYVKDFDFNSGTNISRGDTLAAQLKSRFHYEEKFGAGYSYNLMDNLTAGFSLRYFTQEFTNDQASLRYDNSSTSISIESVTDNNNFWIGDVGFSYSPVSNISFGLSTVNLLKLSEGSLTEENQALSLRTDKAVMASINYRMNRSFEGRLIYETGGSFQGGLNFAAGLASGNLSISASLFHDKYQKPLIAGIIPGVNFTSGMFSVSLSAVKYFSERIKPFTMDEFTSNGLHNIINNPYSFNRAVLSVNFALNTIEEKLVRFADVKIVQDIYPALSENYLDQPFAIAKVVNLSPKAVYVKPSSIIPGLNTEKVQSPVIMIPPGDTAEIPFFTIIDQRGRTIEKTGIAQASFFLNTEGSAPDDEFQKPVLVNDIHSWDGRVSNLHYFVWRDLENSLSYAKNLLKDYKPLLDTIAPVLTNFYTAKILFNNFVKQMVYVADPRASANRVQFPAETLRLKGGACDDLSVSFGSILESVGIQTAFVDFKSDSGGTSHVNLLFNSGLNAGDAQLITNNDIKYVLRKNTSGKDEVWIPLEMTSLKDFDSAWETAALKFNSEAIEDLGLAKGKVQIVDIY